ncbi:MAG: sigma-70 family RNA polymerase sigma factor [Coriobacteriales bacterium]|nr:sigma-70 family RNA polymerase sigma factor [Coriobacteriales bacterium]
MRDREASARLAEAARDGDEAAFETLVREHTPAVWAHAMRFFGDSSAAEDVVQEVWIHVYRGLPQFQGGAAFSTWLFRVTRNVCVDMLRSGSRRPVPVDAFERDVPVPDESGAVDLSASVERAIRALAPEDRDAFGAVALFGLTYAEAAESLGVPAGTVKSRVFRARRAIAASLDDQAGGA